MYDYSFCWTKMGSESGEGLEGILRRKEMERIAGDGLFLWGIGNALGGSLNQLANEIENPPILFSPMKSKPKSADENPERLFLWTAFEDSDGVVRQLPEHSLVTSRNGERHYALFCWSQSPITDAQLPHELDFHRLRNFRTKSPLGYSQVTAVVEQMTDEMFLDVPYDLARPARYPVAFSARLVAPYCARLAMPIELGKEVLAELSGAEAMIDSPAEWKRFVADVRQRYTLSQPEQGQFTFSGALTLS